jgi:hypothetical protein
LLLFPRAFLLTTLYRSKDNPTRTPWAWVPSLPEEESPPEALASALPSLTTSSSRVPSTASAAAAVAQNQPPQTGMRSSVPFHSQPQLQHASAPERSDSPRPLPMEDPAQKRARETAPRMFPNGPLSSASAQAQAHAERGARASAQAQPAAPRLSVSAATQPLSSASAQAAALQAQRIHVPSPHVSPPSQASAPQRQRQRLAQAQEITAPTPSRPGEREPAYSERRELRTTFSPKIIRTPNHYEHGSETPRASASASANPPVGGGLQRAQTLPDFGVPGPAVAGRAVASGVARQQSMPVTLSSTRERPARGATLSTLANFAEEPENLLSPLIDNKSLFGTAGSDPGEGSGSSTVSDATVVDEAERPREMASFAHAAELIRASASTGNVPRAERVRDVEREERDRQPSGSSSGSGREKEREQRRREKEREREREAEVARERERDEREERGREERESHRREKESRRAERERTRSRSRFAHDTEDNERERGGSKRQSSRPPASTSYGVFYSSQVAASGEPSRMERSASHSSEDATSPHSTHFYSPYHRSPKDSTSSSSSHGTPASMRQHTPSSARASSRPPSLQPSPNRTHFSNVPSPQIAPPAPQPYHPAQAQGQSHTPHPKPTTPSPNAYPMVSPTKPAPPSSYPYAAAPNHASAQAEPSPAQAQPVVQYSNGAITYASAQAVDVASRHHRDRDRPVDQSTGYGHRGADASRNSAAHPSRSSHASDEYVSHFGFERPSAEAFLGLRRSMLLAPRITRRGNWTTSARALPAQRSVSQQRTDTVRTCILTQLPSRQPPRSPCSRTRPRAPRPPRRSGNVCTGARRRHRPPRRPRSCRHRPRGTSRHPQRRTSPRRLRLSTPRRRCTTTALGTYTNRGSRPRLRPRATPRPRLPTLTPPSGWRRRRVYVRATGTAVGTI